MKQTKKLTRSQKEFLTKKGYAERIDKIRFCGENPKEVVFYDTDKESKIVFQKEAIRR